MGDEVQLDKEAFHNRLSGFLAQWRNDKRAGDSLFGGVGSIVIVMGKSDMDKVMYQKNNAFQVGDYALVSPPL